MHPGIYAVFFLANTLVLLLRTLFTVTAGEPVDLALVAITAACSVAWWLLLRAKGEEARVSMPHLGPGSEERILRQLDSLNATLLKVSPKSGNIFPLFSVIFSKRSTNITVTTLRFV